MMKGSQVDLTSEDRSQGGWVSHGGTGGGSINPSSTSPPTSEAQQKKQQQETLKRNYEVAKREANCCCISVRYASIFIFLALLMAYQVPSVGQVAAGGQLERFKVTPNLNNHRLWRSGNAIAGEISTRTLKERARLALLAAAKLNSSSSTTVSTPPVLFDNASQFSAFLRTTFTNTTAGGASSVVHHQLNLHIVLWNQTSQSIIASSSGEATEEMDLSSCHGASSCISSSSIINTLVQSLKSRFTSYLPTHSHAFATKNPLLAGRLESGASEKRGDGVIFSSLANEKVLMPATGEEQLYRMLRIPIPVLNPTVLRASPNDLLTTIAALEMEVLQILNDKGNTTTTTSAADDVFECYLLIAIAEEERFLFSPEVIFLVCLCGFGAVVAVMLVVTAQVTMATPLGWIITTSVEVESLDFTALATSDEVIAKQSNFQVKELYSTFINLVWRVENLSIYLSKPIVRELASLGTLANTGGSSSLMENRRLTVVVIDIARFTSICEALPMDIFLSHIGQYFEVTSRVLLLHGCTIDKYVGDATFGFWGAPLEFEDQGFSACAATLHLKAVVRRLRRRWLALGHDLEVRVGLHQGPALVGTVGSAERLVYTAIGSTVNIACALEEAGKKFNTGSTILISSNVLRDAQRCYRRLFITRLVGSVESAGRQWDALELVGLDVVELGKILVQAGQSLAATVEAQQQVSLESGCEGGGPLGGSHTSPTEHQSTSEGGAEFLWENQQVMDDEEYAEYGDQIQQSASMAAVRGNSHHPAADVPSSSSPMPPQRFIGEGGSEDDGRQLQQSTNNISFLGLCAGTNLSQVTQVEELQSIHHDLWIEKDGVVVCRKLTHCVSVSRGDHSGGNHGGVQLSNSGGGGLSPLTSPISQNVPTFSSGSEVSNISGIARAVELLTQLMTTEGRDVLRRLGVSIPVLEKMQEQWKRGKAF